MKNPSFRDLARNRELSVGAYICEFATPGIGHILRSAGCEFAMVDMEHSGFGFETVGRILRHLHDAGVASMVRPPSKTHHHIARACDIGAQGVVPPMLETPEEARRMVQAIKYPPEGSRGVALGIAHDDYRPGPVDQKFKEANAKTCLVALIESAEGVANAEEIAAVEGVDCLWVGHFDLSCSLGIPGQFEHPDFQKAVGKIIAAAKHYNKGLGRLAADLEEGAGLLAAGFDMVVYSTDVALFRSALSAGLEGLRRMHRERDEKGG